MERKRIIYQGRVQGVGFRYTTVHAASNHEITGYVKNLPDGSVEVVAEGAPDAIASFLRDIENRMNRYIHDKTVYEEPPQGDFKGFHVRF